MPHKFIIEKNKKGEFVAKFKYNSELMFRRLFKQSFGGERDRVHPQERPRRAD